MEALRAKLSRIARYLRDAGWKYRRSDALWSDPMGRKVRVPCKAAFRIQSKRDGQLLGL